MTESAPEVLMVTNMWPREDHPSYGIFVKRQIESLRALGLRCQIMVIDGHRSRWAYLRAALRLLAMNWSRSRPRLIHAHGGETAFPARFYFRGPVIVSYCGDDLLGTPGPDGAITALSKVRRFVIRQHARLMTASIAKSEELQAALPPPARRRNEVIPNGVDRSRFRPLSRADARRRLDLPVDARIVLFASNPKIERKRYWLAEAACREAERALGEIRLEVAKVAPPTLMPVLMAAADCLILTSALEGSPNVVKEAVSCGLPVVTTEVGDVCRVLRDVKPSWICSADPRRLAEALVECLAEPRRSDGPVKGAWLDEAQIGRRVLELYDRTVREIAPGTSAVSGASA